MAQLPISKALGVIIGILSMFLIWFYTETKELKAELIITKNERDMAKANSAGLVKELGKLKESIESNAVIYDRNIKAYEEALKSIKENVNYVEVKSDECKDIKAILDDISSNGY